MSLATLTGIPNSIEQGSTVLFTENFPDYPVGTWTAKLVLSMLGKTPVSFTATTSGTDFLFTLSETNTGTIAPGWWDYAIYVNTSTQRTSAKSGRLAVQNNLAIAQPQSPAEQMLEALNSAILEVSGEADVSVSFNGQSFTKADLGGMLERRARLQAEVYREQQKLRALRGTAQSNFIGVKFSNL